MKIFQVTAHFKSKATKLIEADTEEQAINQFHEEGEELEDAGHVQTLAREITPEEEKAWLT